MHRYCKKKMIPLLTVALGFLFATPVYAEPQMSILAKLSVRPGNPAVGPDGSIYFSQHPFDDPEFKLMRLEQGTAEPYPSTAESKALAAVIGVNVDAKGVLWALDMGNDQVSPKLIGWDTADRSLKSIYVIPREASSPVSFFQDFVIDDTRGRIYIADMGLAPTRDQSRPAIVVVDLKTGQMRRRFEGHKALMPDMEKPMRAEGKQLLVTTPEGKAADVVLGLNPIAIDPAAQWVYFSVMQPGIVYRLPAEKLADFNLSDEQILEHLKPYGPKPASDGMAVGQDGTVYITNVDQSGINIVKPEGSFIWFQDESLIWPDALALEADGNLIATVNQLNRVARFNGGSDGTEPPFLIVRFQEQKKNIDE